MSGAKTNFNNQFGLVSLTGGDPVPTFPAAAAEGDGVPMLLDAFGRPWVVSAGGGGGGGEVMPVPPLPTGGPHSQSQAAITASVIGGVLLTIAPGILFSCTAMNDKGSAAYLQVFNQVPPPLAGFAPLLSWRIPQSGMQTPLMVDFGPYGIYLNQMMHLVISDDLLIYDPTGVSASDHTLSAAWV